MTTPGRPAPTAETPHSPASATSTPPGRPRRRQERGQRRIAQLLDAAARVFCSVGYGSASTNAIAREAGVSPGTLYQFFPNKEAIGDALSERLVAEMQRAHAAALSPENALLPLPECLDRVIDPLVEFNLGNPVCFALLRALPGTDTPTRLETGHAALHRAMVEQVRAFVAILAPHLDDAALSRAADICWSAFFGVLHVLYEKDDPAERAALVVELKRLLHGYLVELSA